MRTLSGIWNGLLDSVFELNREKEDDSPLLSMIFSTIFSYIPILHNLQKYVLCLCMLIQQVHYSTEASAPDC